MNTGKSTFPPLSSSKASMVAYPLSCVEYIKEIPKCDRQSLVEWRVGVQESITAGILEKISLLKADMIEHLKNVKYLESEQHSNKEYFAHEIRTLLQNTEKLNVEVKSFEESVREKWTIVKDTSNALKNLENHHFTNVADIKGRITRCDQTISNLSHKLNQIAEEIRSLTDNYRRDITDLNNYFKVHEHKTEWELQSLITDIGKLKLAETTNQAERNSTILNTSMKRSEETLYRQITEVERRFQQNLNEIQHNLQNSFQSCQNEKNSLEARLNETLNSMILSLENRIILLEEKITQEKFDEELYEKIDTIQSESSHFKQQVLKTFKEIENRMNKMSDDLYEQQRQSLDVIRDEIQEGFHTMHDTISSTKSVLDNKLRIVEDTLHMELSQLRKLIVLV